MMWMIIFWISVVCMFHSYVWYPMLLQVMASGKKLRTLNLTDDELPEIVVVMSVYNGERLIKEKVESIFKSNYPAHKIFAYIGSDHSGDATNKLLTKQANKYPNLKAFLFQTRQGKINVVNRLFTELKKDGKEQAVVVMTDLSAMFHPDCFRHLVQTLTPEVALAGAYILKGEHREDGISFQEKTYYERELQMKYQEGLLWGASMGAFGACYALRMADIKPIPSNFLVDDFFMTMQVLRQGKKAVYSEEALVYMDVPNESSVEFNRKVRISAGNFQNLKLFWPMLFGFNAVSFALWSHKVIRWLGAFFILAAWLSSGVLAQAHFIYYTAFLLQTLLLMTPLMNYFFEKNEIHLKLLKFVAHFYLMNLGILVGFFNFVKGIKTNVWTPTQR